MSCAIFEELPYIHFFVRKEKEGIGFHFFPLLNRHLSTHYILDTMDVKKRKIERNTREENQGHYYTRDEGRKLNTYLARQYETHLERICSLLL